MSRLICKIKGHVTPQMRSIGANGKPFMHVCSRCGKMVS